MNFPIFFIQNLLILFEWSSTPYTVPTEKQLDIQFVTNPFTGYHVIIDTGSVTHDQVRRWNNIPKEKLMAYSNFQLDVTKAAVSHFIQLLPDGLTLSVDWFHANKSTILAPVSVNITQKRTAQRGINSLKKTADSVNGVIAALQEGLVVRSFIYKWCNFP